MLKSTAARLARRCRLSHRARNSPASQESVWTNRIGSQRFVAHAHEVRDDHAGGPSPGSRHLKHANHSKSIRHAKQRVVDLYSEATVDPEQLLLRLSRSVSD